MDDLRTIAYVTGWDAGDPPNDDPKGTVAVAFLWKVYNAVAIKLVMHAADDIVAWTFGRDLLNEGLAGPAGDADVVVWPDDDDLCIRLESPDGTAVLRFRNRRRMVENWLRQTYKLVPAGAEVVPVDGFLRKLFREVADDA